ncbi:hypothetical protein SPRG_19035 [Saprolegnia parasitica CBS 223.65]|uniref:Uncharacterized protein n=1 Tax=Saprolegnia parasitica (strain CBS 223.65) TaxID=695850 RepID=A0A067CY88_SAPPC|nr:hypothetical protein SPRG_19035 [Saprolegnia parasitica CBS 223.65]KDO34190.1 hypothetical protein SPRG_19035 [Saprolegnia parasitica CBS 223.65]|eukprot:XP_012195233.1 hypothetical protein SPRG_19035 [Saprolegnia parasitica CBS 223.65]
MDLLQGYESATSDDTPSPPRLKRKAASSLAHAIALPTPNAAAYQPKRRAVARAPSSAPTERPPLPALLDADAAPPAAESSDASVPSRELQRWRARYRVNCVRWNPQFPALLATAGMSATMHIYDAFRAACKRQLDGLHTDAIKDVQWALDGRSLVSASYDHTLVHVDVETMQARATYAGAHRFTALAMHPSDMHLVLAGDDAGYVVCWDMRANTVRALQQTCGEVHALAFLPKTASAESRTQFLSSSTVTKTSAADKAVAVWDFSSGALIKQCIYSQGYTCSSISVHPTAPYLALQSHGNYMATVSTRSLKLSKTRYEGHTSQGYGIHCSFNATGALLASGDVHGHVFVYASQRPRVLFSARPHTNVCMAVECHPRYPHVLATGGWDNIVTVWT